MTEEQIGTESDAISTKGPPYPGMRRSSRQAAPPYPGVSRVPPAQPASPQYPAEGRALPQRSTGMDTEPEIGGSTSDLIAPEPVPAARESPPPSAPDVPTFVKADETDADAALVTPHKPSRRRIALVVCTLATGGIIVAAGALLLNRDTSSDAESGSAGARDNEPPAEQGDRPVNSDPAEDQQGRQVDPTTTPPQPGDDEFCGEVPAPNERPIEVRADATWVDCPEALEVIETYYELVASTWVDGRGSVDQDWWYCSRRDDASGDSTQIDDCWLIRAVTMNEPEVGGNCGETDAVLPSGTPVAVDADESWVSCTDALELVETWLELAPTEGESDGYLEIGSWGCVGFLSGEPIDGGQIGDCAVTNVISTHWPE